MSSIEYSSSKHSSASFIFSDFDIHPLDHQHFFVIFHKFHFHKFSTMQEPCARWQVTLNGTLVTLFSETQLLLEYIGSNFVIQLRFSTGTFLLSRFQQNLKFSCRFVNIFIQSFSYVNFVKYFHWCKWGSSSSFLANVVLCLCVEHYSYAYFLFKWTGKLCQLGLFQLLQHYLSFQPIDWTS